ncbi:unnamed protein product [Colias eurytheme]|nr:unnamed protein product [Colias eurytheme]
MASMNIFFENQKLTGVVCECTNELKQIVSQKYGVPYDDLYVTSNGKIVSSDGCLHADSVIRVCKRLVGGKGGFGSMLRAIGAQIEKTTNREACRDLSGRRLRDINEEKRLRKWLEGQEDREREAAERKQKKLEKLLAEPKIDVNLNPSYEKEREELPERVSSAVEAGWEAAGSSNERKRKSDEVQQKKKKAKLWIDAELSDCSSLSEDEEEIEKPKAKSVSTDSGNESDRTAGSSKRQYLTAFLLLSLLALAASRPQEFEDEDDVDRDYNSREEVPRVQIKVYRGPTKHDGFAPWGFWVKQPSDDK